jgi:probable HAF family extracellular repeat protein
MQLTRKSIAYAVAALILVPPGSPAYAGPGGQRDPSMARPPPYRMVSLGSLGGGDTLARAINDHAVVVGQSTTGSGAYHPFLWRLGAMIDLGGLGPADESGAASDVNIHGDVVGVSGLGDYVSHAFLWRRGVMIDLGTLGGERSHATAINDHGQVVGWSDTAGGALRPFLWQRGRMTDLGPEGTALDINERGHVVGDLYFGDGSRPYLWRRNKVTDLGSLPGRMEQTRPVAVNNRDWVVGYDDYRAFLWRAGTMRALPTLGGFVAQAVSVNDRGQIVGSARDHQGMNRQVIWDGDTVTDLSTRGVPAPDDGGPVEFIRDVNNQAQLVSSTNAYL